jgi:transcription antitermination factor NusG
MDAASAVRVTLVRPPLGSVERWYAVHTRSNFEKRIATELSAKGIETFVPSYQEVHQWKDRKQKLEVPLFAGYVFTRFADQAETRIAVLRTTGVARILGGVGTIEPVPDHEIEAVRSLMQYNVACYPCPILREGAWVRVIRGALTGAEGLLVRIKNQTRLVVSVTLLSRSVSAEIDARDVEPMQKPD